MREIQPIDVTSYINVVVFSFLLSVKEAKEEDRQSRFVLIYFDLKLKFSKQMIFLRMIEVIMMRYNKNTDKRQQQFE